MHVVLSLTSKLCAACACTRKQSRMCTSARQTFRRASQPGRSLPLPHPTVTRTPAAWRTCRLAEQLAAGGVPSGADASDDSFASLADTIMQQLLSKDVLYQPMRDIGDKYPGWLAARR